MKETTGYDVIGDIHGYAMELRALLALLGYEERNGAYRHATRKAVFVGDFVDRGPAIADTLAVVRAMVGQGAAFAVLGNHEFNALCYHTLGANGEPLRSHTVENCKNTVQHQATIDQLVLASPEEWQSYLEWFKGLPLFLELDGLRIVHAAWCETSIRKVRGRSLHDREFLLAAGTKGTAEYRALEALLKGPEIALPAGWSNPDKEGNSRPDMRVAWWKPRPKKRYTYKELAVPGAGPMPPDPIPAGQLEACPEYGATEVPVLFGHYWLPPDAPMPLSRNAGCVDFSVARPNGQLVAYSWSGESKLKAANFRSIPTSCRPAR